MAYSEADLKIIKRFKPDLKTKKVEKPSLDLIIVEFLKKYEVYVKPATTLVKEFGTKEKLKAAGAGALAAIDPDVAGDAFIISGQNKQTQVQEWTQWKQWALDHKDFEAFKNEINSKIEEENNEITDYLESAEFKELADEILASNKKDEEDRQKQDEGIGMIIFAFLVVLIGLMLGSIWVETREESDYSLPEDDSKNSHCSMVYGAGFIWDSKTETCKVGSGK